MLMISMQTIRFAKVLIVRGEKWVLMSNFPLAQVNMVVHLDWMI